MREIREMWEGGPLRWWSDTYVDGYLRRKPGLGYVGTYVCSECRRNVPGVYPGGSSQYKWICGPCRERLRPKQEQPVHLRKKH